MKVDVFGGWTKGCRVFEGRKGTGGVVGSSGGVGRFAMAYPASLCAKAL